MARIELAPGIVDDFDRIVDHLFRHEATDAAACVQDIVDAIDVLGRNPLIGRLTDGGNRELVIGRNARGYIALYRYVAQARIVLVLAIRSQKESGYARE